MYRLPPLEIPPASIDLTANDALTYSAVQLFVERVTSSVGQFELSDTDAPVVADICRRLDGVALAIELAAGRVEVFGLLGVAARLEDRVRLLTHGRRTALPRHQTLTATLDWSYDALSESEQAALRRLSVFAGGFTLDAAQAVAADDLVVSVRYCRGRGEPGLEVAVECGCHDSDRPLSSARHDPSICAEKAGGKWRI